MKTISFLLLSVVLFGCTKKEESTTSTGSKDSAAIPKPDTAKDGTVAAPSAAMTGAALAGQKIYYSTTYGKIKDACASCHSDGQATTKDARLRAGHTLVGVTSRPSTWNGQFKSDALAKNGYGATMCAVMYQHKGDDVATVIPKADIDAINAYLDAIKSAPGGMTSELKIQWVTKPAVHDEDKIDEKAANAAAKTIIKLPADPTAGKIIFDKTCAYCHSMTEKKVGPALNKAMENASLAARAIRCGSGAMPFYAKDLLTDQQIADAIAYVQQQLGK